MSKILVTGAAGFIASSLVRSLLDRGHTVIGVDNLLTGTIQNVSSLAHPNYKFIKADVNATKDLTEIFCSHSFNFVFHYAAVVGVQRTLEYPLLVLNDIQGINNILSLSKNTGVERIFFSSSSEVYGEPVEMPQHEVTTPLNSRLPYAIVKNVGEAYVRSFQFEHNLDYTIFRFFNTYGPHQSPDFVVSKFFRSALKNEPITIYGDGSQTRTFCYIDDNIDTSILCLEKSLCVNDVLNVGSHMETSVLDLAKAIISITKSSSPIVHLDPLLEGDMTRRRPDNTKMLEILNRPLSPLSRGLANLYHHYTHE